MGHLHDLRLREAVLLGGLLADVFEQRHHGGGVEGKAVGDQLWVGLCLASLPLLGHLHSVSLRLRLDRLEAALLDRVLLNRGCRLETSQGGGGLRGYSGDTYAAVVLVLNLGPGDLNVLAHVLSDGLAGLGGDGVLLRGAVRRVVEEGVAEPNLRLRSRQGLAGGCQEQETDQVVHAVAGVEILPEVTLPHWKFSF